MNNLNIINTFENFNKNTDDYLGVMFINVFKTFSKCYRVYYDTDENLQYEPSVESFYETRKNLKFKVNDRELLKRAIQDSKVNDKIKVFCYSSHEYLILGDLGSSRFLINITCSEDVTIYEHYIDVYTDYIEDTFEFIKKYFVKADNKEDVEFGIAAIDPTNSLYTSWYEYNKQDIDIDKNYNDDFKVPYEKICELIEEEGKASLMLFYGDPGTGKSSVIKHLIGKYPDKDFIFMDGSLLANVGQEKLMSYFLDNNDTIFILEDCEKSLANREHNFNPVMPVLLNITDGIIADVLGIKIICTFNTALSNIDPALKRKGRLSLKYEFKKLAKDKCQKIIDSSDLIKEKFTVNEDMTLAELYNHDDENDYSKKPSKKIGF